MVWLQFTLNSVTGVVCRGGWDFGVDGAVYVQLTVDSATTSKIRPYIALANKEFELWMKLDA